MSPEEIRANVLARIMKERRRQDEKWGVQRHDPFLWMSILGEEYGETCREALEHRFGNKSLVDYAKELNQTAAVAVAALESFEECMSDPTVYLAGPMADCDDVEAAVWRDEAERMIKTRCLSPMTRDFRGKLIDDPGEQVVRPDKADIDRSIVILANCWKPSAGTSMEIIYAWERGKYVFSIVPEGMYVSPWVQDHSHCVARSLEEGVSNVNDCVRAIKKEYGGV